MRRALILCCATLAVLPATAVAKKSKKPLGPAFGVTATGNVASGIGSSSTATALCPPRTRVIGGGFFTPPRSPAGGDPAVFESYRSSRQGWTSSAQPLGGMPIILWSYGYCRRTNLSISDVSAGATVPPGGTGTAAATCPRGRRLVSGGFQSSTGGSGGSAALPVTDMATAPSTWTVLSTSASPATMNVTVHAYCMRGVRPPVLVSSTASSVLSPFLMLSASSPGCPVPKKAKRKGKKKPRRQLSAGGFSVTSTPSYFRVFNSAKTQRLWTVAAQNASDSNTAATSLTSQGVCL
jgi:hypothetical protein